MPRLVVFVSMLLLIPALPLRGQQKSYCGLVPQIGSIGALPAHTAADDIIDDLLRNGAQITTRNSFRAVGNATDENLKQQVAAAEICNATDRYIFYNPSAVEGMQKGGGGWVKYFLLAHEMAHHINGDTLVHHEDANVELYADENAAKWLTRLGASMPELKAAVDAIEKSEVRRGGYPSHCERVAAATRGYNVVARDYDRYGAKLDLYQEGNCLLTKLETSDISEKITSSQNNNTLQQGISSQSAGSGFADGLRRYVASAEVSFADNGIKSASNGIWTPTMTLPGSIACQGRDPENKPYITCTVYKVAGEQSAENAYKSYISKVEKALPGWVKNESGRSGWSDNAHTVLFDKGETRVWVRLYRYSETTQDGQYDVDIWVEDTR